MNYSKNVDMNTKIISNGTLRPQDLIPKFWEWLSENILERDMASHMGEMTAEDLVFINHCNQTNILEDDDPVWENHGIFFLNEILTNLMVQYPPHGTYFGTQEGDGSCFGFWQIDYSEDISGFSVTLDNLGNDLSVKLKEMLGDSEIQLVDSYDDLQESFCVRTGVGKYKECGIMIVKSDGACLVLEMGEYDEEKSFWINFDDMCHESRISVLGLVSEKLNEA